MIHLAIDIGASSGRHIAAWRENGELIMREIYRFQNLPTEQNGSLIWNLEHLCNEVLNGLAECGRKGIVPDSVGIDTWAVDYVLLDKDDKAILPMYCYRDERGAKAAEKLHEIIPFSELYSRTGIQYQPFNSIYQLYSDKLCGRLDMAEDFLLLPEYLAFSLCGNKAHEYTNCSSTGLLDAKNKTWDMEIIRKLELPEKLFEKAPILPPVKLGRLTEAVQAKVGFDCDVILPATHDTGSAVAAVPVKGAYISSGTWSLLGAELEKPVTSDAARAANFTNEGGVGTIRFLKNIMGLWLVQCLKREYNDEYSFAKLAEMARNEAKFDYSLDVNAAVYLAPKSVIACIEEECRDKGWPVPQTPGEFAHAIYNSLAHAYAAAMDELESITRQSFDSICIVGGGVNNIYLNELTEKVTGRKVICGSPEATALGNILLQEAAYV